jgi:hypothetical protein
MGDAGKVCETPVCAHLVKAGFRLCGQCRQGVARELLSLPALFRDCEAEPPGIADVREAGRVCADIVDILSSWCSLVVCERGGIAPATKTVEDMVVFLDMSLGWLARHDAGGDFVVEVRELAAAARGVVAPREVLGVCDRGGCGRDILAGGADVRCEDGHEWRPAEWLSLGKRVRSTAASGQRARKRRSGRRA